MLQRRLQVTMLALSFLATLACSKATTKKDEPRDEEPATNILGLTEPSFKTAQRQLVDAAIGRSRAEIPAGLAETDQKIAAEQAGANRPEVIAALQQRRANQASKTTFYPKIIAYTQAAYGELQALLRAGNAQPGLTHKATGAETP
jgi:hypothetical protein